MPQLLPSVEINTAPNPSAAVIWLHGLGADGHDFAALVPELDLTGCPPIRFVFPHAPSQPVTVNGGYVMPAWYDLYGPDLVKRQDEAGIRTSEKAIHALIAREMARGISPENIVLAGFSQGCAMALHTGLRCPHTLAGLVALSGYLPLAGLFPAEREAANANTPIFMAHGNQDTVVVPARGEASRDQLSDLGYAVEWHSYPMPHSVHPREVADISQFLARVLSKSAR
jgi:phospholipase/carboxylesterase